MKIKEGFKLRKVCDNAVVVAVGKATLDLNGLVTLNGSGEFLWKELEKGAEKKELINAFIENYEVDEKQAEADIDSFLAKLKGAGIIE